MSVRSLTEARMASRFRIDILDLKDPSRGALGAVDESVRAAVAENLPRRLVKSAALGEMRDGDPVVEGLAPFRYAKVGLAGMNLVANWQQHWLGLRASLPIGVQLVAVAYADHAICQAPSVEAMLELTQSESTGILLLDTFDKKNGNLIELLGLSTIQQLIETAHGQQTKIVIAGSINTGQLAHLLPLNPDYVGIRGAACRFGRDHLCDSQLEKFCQRFRFESTKSVGENVLHLPKFC